MIGDLVVTGCDRTSLAHTYAFRLDTGDVVWKQPRAAFHSDAIAVGPLAVGRRWNGDLVALDVGRGEPRWTVGPADYTYRPAVDLSPVEKEGVLYFGGVDGRVYAVDGTSGDVLWSADLTDAVTTSPATNGVHLYVGVAGNRVHRLDARTGERLGSVETSDRPFGRLVLGEDFVIALAGEAELVAWTHDLEILWVHSADRPWTSYQPLLWRGLVVAGTRGGDVFAHEATTGEVAFTLSVDGTVRGIGADEEALYVGTLGGTLWAVTAP